MEKKLTMILAVVIVVIIAIAAAAVVLMNNDDDDKKSPEDGKIVDIDVNEGTTITTDVISEVGKNSTANITIKGDSTNVDQKIDAAAVAKLKENNNVLTVKNKAGTSISLDKDTIAALDGSKDLELVVSSSTTVADAEFKTAGAVAVVEAKAINGSAVSKLGGNATISFPYTLKTGETADKINVWYKETLENGKTSYTSYDASYANGYVTFTTTHFSDYYAAFKTLADAGFYETFSMTTYVNYSGDKATITFTEKPTRIVAGCNTALNMLLYFGLGDSIVGIYYMEEDVWDEVADEYAKVVARIGSDHVLTGNIDKATLTSWAPDLVIGWVAWNDEKGLGSESYWNEIGCNVMSFNTMVADGNMEGMESDYSNFGKIFNIRDETAAYMTNFEKKMDSVKGVLSDVDATIAVYDGLGNISAADMSDFWFYGDGDFIVYVLENMGADVYKGKVSKATLYNDCENIDIMFFVCYGKATFEKTQSIWASDSVLAATPAVANQQLSSMKLSVAYGADPSLMQVLDDLKELLEKQKTIYTPSVGAIGTYVPVYGNANADLYVDSKDVELIQQVVDGEVVWNKLTNPYVDANNDGKITADDVALVQKIINYETCTVYYQDYYNEVEAVHFPLTDRNIAVTYYQQAEICNILGLMDNIKCASLAAAGQYVKLYPHLGELTDSQVFGTTGSSTLNDDAVEKIKKNDVSLIIGTPSSGNYSTCKTLRENNNIDTIMLWYNGDYCYSTMMTVALFTNTVAKAEAYMDYCNGVIDVLTERITSDMKKSVLILDNYYTSSSKYSIIASDNNGSFTMINKYLGNAYTNSKASEFGFINLDVDWLMENQASFDYIVFVPTPCGFRDLKTDSGYDHSDFFSRDAYNASIESTLTYLEKTDAYKNGNIVVSSYDNTFGYSTYAMLILMAAQMYPDLFTIDEGLEYLQTWFDTINVADVDVNVNGAFSYTGTNYKTSYPLIDGKISDDSYVAALKETQLPVLGNVNGDAVIDSKDVTLINELISSGAHIRTNLLADANHDGVINEADATLVQNMIDGKTCKVWHINYWDNDKDGVMNYVLTETSYPITSVIISGSANTGLMMLELGLTDIVHGAAYSSTSLDKTLYKDTLLNTDKVKKIGDSATKIVYENSEGTGASGVIKEFNVTALITDWNQTYITNYADFDNDTVGVDVIRFCASSTNVNDASASIRLLGFLTQNVKTANSFADYNAGLFNQLSSLVSYIPEDEKYSAVASSYDNSISSQDSDYTKVVLSAGATFGCEGFNFGGKTSVYVKDNVGILDYEYDYIVHIRTLLGYSPIDSEKLESTWATYTDSFSAVTSVNPDTKQILVSGAIPIPFRIAYTMSALYPEVLEKATVDSMFQTYLNDYLKVDIDVSTLTLVYGVDSTPDTPVAFDAGSLLVYGNADSNSVLDSKDESIISDIIAGTKSFADYPLADANYDGKVDSADLDVVKKLIAGDSTTAYVINQLTEEDKIQLVSDGVSQSNYTVVPVAYPLKNVVTVNSDITGAAIQVGASAYIAGYIATDYANSFTPIKETAKALGTARTFDDSKYKSFVDLYASKVKDGKTIDAIIIYNANAISGYEKNFESYKIPVIVAKCTMVKESLSAQITLGFLFGKTTEALGLSYSQDTQKVFNEVAEMLSGLTDEQKEKALSLCMNYYIAQTESQYSQISDLAGLVNLSTTPGTSSDKLVQADTIAKYNDQGIDALISYTTKGYGVMTSKEIKTMWEFKNYSMIKGSSACPDGLIYINLSMPMAARVAYLAEYYYSDVVTDLDGYGDKVFQHFVDTYLTYLDATQADGDFDVSTDCTSIVDYADYQAATSS